jgi:hypothetical protein
MNTPQIGERYKLYKGNEYEIVALAKHSETLEELVVYKALYGEGQVWVRPLEMFLDVKTLEDGTHIQRFTKIG